VAEHDYAGAAPDDDLSRSLLLVEVDARAAAD